ncbi:MAG TPA: glycosyltransferase [Cellvibrionaceae bacterium]
MNASETIKLTLNELWHKYLRIPAATINLMFAKIFFALKSNENAFRFCSRSLRYQISADGSALLKKLIVSTPLDNFVSKKVTIKGAAQRSIVLKWPEFDGEKIQKGILLTTFTGTFSYFINHTNSALLEKLFILVLEPSWSGYADADILGLCKLQTKIVVECPEIQDRALLNEFPENFVATSFGASDWVNHKEFKPSSAAKIYDSIYIANANPIKRVLRYVQAVKNIVEDGHATYKACLVCAAWGGSRESIEKIIQKYRLGDNLVLKFSLSKQEVIEHLNLSKANILLSYKEGSNRSLFESMFCNIPVICIYENIGVNKAYINEHTGLLVQDAHIEEALVWLAQNYTCYSPREWALTNIAPEVTTQKLADVIKSRLNQKNLNSSTIMVKTNNPEVQYMDWPELEFYDINETLFQIFEAKQMSLEDASKAIKLLKENFNTRLASCTSAHSVK